MSTSPPALTADEQRAGLEVARRQRVAVFVVAYNAEAKIRETLRRIPAELWETLACVYVIDDKSTDATTHVARELVAEFPKLRVFTTPYNQGYGGNQKIGYRYAVEQGFDVVALLHGDGQYAPEVLPRLLAPFADDATAAVFGSRMMVAGAARRGRMPLYKRVGNRVLTTLQNTLLGASLSEFHSGYRAYRVADLAGLPFRYNTNDFHFDTEIIIQLLGSGRRIVEVPIPTYYGDEICHVNGLKYAAQCVGTVFRALANRVHLVYHPKFDLEPRASEREARYSFKEAPTSLHQFVLRRPTRDGDAVVELGASTGELSQTLEERGARVVAVDQERPDLTLAFPYLERDLDEDFAVPILGALGSRADQVVALDVLEHLKEPERAVREIHRVLAPGGVLLASTGNVAYFLLRVVLLFGQFNYGKKGILDLTHKRLFTVRSFKRLLEGEGFRVESVRGFGPPIEDMVGDSWLLKRLDRVASWLAKVWPSLFAYQFCVEATRLDDVDDLLVRTVGPPTDARRRR